MFGDDIDDYVCIDKDTYKISFNVCMILCQVVCRWWNNLHEYKYNNILRKNDFCDKNISIIVENIDFNF